MKIFKNVITSFLTSIIILLTICNLIFKKIISGDNKLIIRYVISFIFIIISIPFEIISFLMIFIFNIGFEEDSKIVKLLQSEDEEVLKLGKEILSNRCFVVKRLLLLDEIDEHEDNMSFLNKELHCKPLNLLFSFVNNRKEDKPDNISYLYLMTILFLLYLLLNILFKDEY